MAQEQTGNPGRASRIWIDWRSIVASAAALAIAFGLVFIAWMILRPLAILLMSIILAETLEPVVTWLEKRMRRSFAVLVTYLSVVFVLILLLLTLLPVILTQVGNLTEQVPESRDQVMSWIDEQGWVSSDQISGYLEGQMGGGGGGLASIPIAIVSGVVELALAVFLSIYWLIGKPGAKSLMLSMIPPHRRDEAEDIAAEVGSTIGGYIRGAVMTGAVIATIGFVGLTIIGIDYALPLAMIMFFGELVPVLGPMIAFTPVLLLAALDGVTTFLLAIGLYIALQLIESSFVYPQIMKHETSIPPLLVIFALFAGGSVGGIIGALVAIPLSGAIRVLILRLIVPWVQENLGHNEPV